MDDDKLYFDLSQALASSGADIERLVDLEKNFSTRWHLDGSNENEPEVIAALGPFNTNIALLRGELRYANPLLPDGLQRVKFVAWTWLLNARRKGLPRPPTNAYSVVLPPSGGRRSIYVPIAQEVRDGDTDRFTLRIASPRSSRHRFQIRLVYGIDQSVLSSCINLDLFMPRSAARFLAKREEKAPT